MSTSVGSRSITAVFWGAGGSALRMVLQIGTQIVLARLLGPTEYGVFAIGSIVIGFSGFFSDIGLAYGLIQKREVNDRDVRFVFTWQVLLGGAVSVAVAFASGPIASFFGEPRAASVVLALSVLCLVNALAAPAMNLLKRKIDFKSIHLAFLASYIVGYVFVGIPMAILGYKVWALVAAWIVQASVNGLLLYRCARHALWPLLWYDEARVQSAYGGTVLATNLLNWLIGNIDRVIIGRLLSAKEMGIYSNTFNLLYSPTSSVLSVLQPVFFSATARVAHEDDGQRITRGFTTLVAAIATLILPIFLTIAVIAETVILSLYGREWLDSAEVCRPLALAMPFFLIWGMSTPLLWASGNASREFRSQWPLALLWGIGCWLLARMGLVAVAWGIPVLFTLRCGVTVRMAAKLLNFNPWLAWHAARGGVFLSVLVAGVLGLLDAALGEFPPQGRLLADFVCGVAIMLGILRMMPSLIAPELADLLARVFSKLPPNLARQLAFLTVRGSQS